MRRVPIGAVLILSLVTMASAVACRRKPKPPVPGGPTTSAAASQSSGPSSGVPPFEKFVAARTRGDGKVDVVGVTRTPKPADDKVIIVTLDGSLVLQSQKELAAGFEATDESSITIASPGLVVAIGRLGQESGVFLLREDGKPRAIEPDWCLAAGGVGWMIREKGAAKVQFVRTGSTPMDATSGSITVPNEHEAHLACGPDQLVMWVGDGDHLALARLRPDTPSFTAPALVDLETETDFKDELRERFVLPRSGDDVVLLRIGEKVAMRELVGKDATPHAWTFAHGEKSEFKLDEESDVVEIAAAPNAGDTVWMLASEPQKGAPCAGGDQPRRIVLHGLKITGKGSTRPVVELACGIEAIRAHLRADAKGANLWWTEPITDGRCSFPGLAVGAVVEASSDRPGARNAPTIAEGVTRLEDGRFLSVVRAGGCAAYDAPGNGMLAWGPILK